MYTAEHTYIYMCVYIYIYIYIWNIHCSSEDNLIWDIFHIDDCPLRKQSFIVVSNLTIVFVQIPETFSFPKALGKLSTFESELEEIFIFLNPRSEFFTLPPVYFFLLFFFSFSFREQNILLIIFLKKYRNHQCFIYIPSSGWNDLSLEHRLVWIPKTICIYIQRESERERERERVRERESLLCVYVHVCVCVCVCVWERERERERERKRQRQRVRDGAESLCMLE